MQPNKYKTMWSSKLLQSKVFWAALSVLASLLIWCFYTTTYGVEMTKVFQGVEVTYSGETAMRDSLGLIITDEETDTVTVTLTGPRRYILNLTPADISANVDLAKITRYGDKSMNYTLVYSGNVDSSAITVERKSPEYLAIRVSKLSSKPVEVRGEFTGTVLDGFAADETMTFEPATVTVSGPEEELAEIDHAYVAISREGVSSSITAESTFTLCNADGEELQFGDVTSDVSTVYAALTIYMTKEVALDVTLVDGGGATAANVAKHISPSSITLAGDSATLAGVNTISLATIDLSDYSSFPATEYTITLPNDTENISGITTATVNLEFSGLATRLYTITNLSYVNCDPGYQASIMPTSLVVTIRAPQEILDQIAENNIRAVADLSGVTVTSKVPTTVYVDGFTEAGAVGDYVLWVQMLEEASY